MKYYFIINPIAGNKKGYRIISSLRRNFADSPHEMIIRLTTKEGDACSFAQTIAKQNEVDSVVVCCGGDGTLYEVANGLAGSRTPLLLLPMGTGNDFAKTIYGANYDLNALIYNLQLWATQPNFQIQPIDLMAVNDRYCINVMSFGLSTDVGVKGRQLALKFPILGKQCYNVGVLLALIENKHYQLSMTTQTVDGKTQTHTNPFTLATICNGRYYGGGFCPAPYDHPADGVFTCCIVDGLSRLGIVKLIGSYIKGTARGARIHYSKVVSGTITSTDGSNLPINCDGEPMDCTSVSFQVCPNMLYIARPY